MKVGSDAADTLKKQSELQQIPFANLLWIYMAEDMIQRFYQSSYKEILWLENDEFLEEREDLTRAERQIRFLYKQSERSWPEEKMVPGQKLSIPMMEHLIEEIFGEKNAQQIRWRWNIAQKGAAYEVHLTGKGASDRKLQGYGSTVCTGFSYNHYREYSSGFTGEKVSGNQRKRNLVSYIFPGKPDQPGPV